MRQTLFFVGGDDLWGLPVFGFGWLLIAWALFSIGLLAWLMRKRGFDAETRGYLPILLVIGAVIAFVLPQLEIMGPGGIKLGLAVRGYGVLMLVGVVSGVSVTIYLARRLGVDSEEVFNVAFWMFLFGIAGARLFFIIQFWPGFQRPTLRLTLLEMLKFTEGGLVVYGSVIGSLFAFVLVTRKRHLPMLKMADLIAPGMVLGLALGRLGCLMNGCCYGGLAIDHPCGLTFPKYTCEAQQLLSPPYQNQLTSGRFHGIHLTDGEAGPIVARVEPDSAAAATGLDVGAHVKAVNYRLTANMVDVRRVLEESGPSIAVTTVAGRNYQWTMGGLPRKSFPVHPTQIYSAINALALFLVLWTFYPFRTRDGQVFALMLTLYPVSRFMLEIVRDDEHGQFGTALTISQIMSIGALVCVAVLWRHIAQQPRREINANKSPG